MILIENNVITKDNMINNCNPLLGCSADEIIELIETINMDNCKLLLDTAHLKVSANTVLW